MGSNSPGPGQGDAGYDAPPPTVGDHIVCGGSTSLRPPTRKHDIERARGGRPLRIWAVPFPPTPCYPPPHDRPSARKHPQLRHRRPYRPWQVDARRPPHPADRNRGGARHGRAGARIRWTSSASAASPSRPTPSGSNTGPRTARPTFSISWTRPATSTSPMRCRARSPPARARSWWSTRARGSRRKRSPTSITRSMRGTRSCRSSTRSTCRRPSPTGSRSRSRTSSASTPRTPCRSRPRPASTSRPCSRRSSPACRRRRATRRRR